MQPPQQRTTVQQGGTVYLAGPGGRMYPVNSNQMAGSGYTAAAQRPPNVSLTYSSGQSVYIGANLIIFGSLAIIFNAVAIGAGDVVAMVGHGIWCGIMFIITGAFGIGAKRQHQCMIVTFMVLCIISSIFTIALLGLGIVGATNYSPEPCNGKCNSTATAMEALLATIAFLVAIDCLWGAVIACKAVCCCVPTRSVENGQQQVLLINAQGVVQQYPPIHVMTSSAQPIYQPPVPQLQMARPPQQIQPHTLPTGPEAVQRSVYPSAPTDEFDQFDPELSRPVHGNR